MKLRRVSRMVLLMGLVLSITTLAEAQASRTWVSGVGNDANPCSRTAPCKTFAGALIKTAAGGYINVLDPGGFGAVTINKSVTIDGSGGPHAGILASLTHGIIINGAGIKVTLRNLSIEGFGNGLTGVRILQAAAVHVEKCSIVDFTQSAINLATGSGGVLFVSDTTISHTQGILVSNGRATIENLRAEVNVIAVRAQPGGLVTVRNSIITGGTNGVTTDAASSILNIENTVITNNVIGVDAQGGGTVRLSNTGVFSNSSTGLFNDGSSFIISLSGNTVQGNPTPGSFTSTILKQ